MTRIFIDSSVFFSQVQLLEQILEAVPFQYIRPTKKEVLAAAKLTALKDSPIVAAAKKAKVDFLITLDKKHLLRIPEIAEYAGLPIVTPQEVVKALQKRN